MSRIRQCSSVALILASSIFAACSDSTGPSQPVTVDGLFAELRDAQQSLGAAQGATDNFMFVGVPILPFSALPATANCPFNATSQAFVCPSSTRSGITTSLYYQLLDANDQPQSAFSPTTTAAIRAVNDVSGTITTTGPNTSTTTIDGHGDHTLSGLLTGVHTLDGSSTTDIETSIVFSDQTFTSSVTMTETTTNLVLPARGSQYPTSGSIKLDLTSTGGDAFEAHVTITFNGTNTATMVITVGAETQICAVDLSGKQQPQCRAG